MGEGGGAQSVNKRRNNIRNHKIKIGPMAAHVFLRFLEAFVTVNVYHAVSGQLQNFNNNDSPNTRNFS